MCVCVCVCVCVLQYGAAGGEDPESSGPASEGCQRLLWPIREDLPTARQEEEIPDQGDSHSHDSLTQTVFTPRKENKKKSLKRFIIRSASFLLPTGESLQFH